MYTKVISLDQVIATSYIVTSSLDYMFHVISCRVFPFSYVKNCTLTLQFIEIHHMYKDKLNHTTVSPVLDGSPTGHGTWVLCWSTVHMDVCLSVCMCVSVYVCMIHDKDKGERVS